jgi:DNA-directed RNA polymerase subunit omega
MIEGLKDDRIINQLGGRFKLTALIQRRIVELMQGARPMVETKGLTELEVVVREIMEGKVEAVLSEEEQSLEDEEDDAAL